LREEAHRLHPRLPSEDEVAKAAGVVAADVRTHLGPPDNYSALLSYQGQVPDTRERIIASAARVFGQKGFQRASLDQVASDAGLTKGAIYWHFKSKNDLYFALLDSRFLRDISAMRESVDAMMVTATHETAPDLMARIFSAGLQRFTSDPDWPRLFVEVMGHAREPEVRERIAQFYEQGWEFAGAMVRDMQAAGLIRRDISPDFLASFWFAIGDGLILAWLTQPERIDLDAMASGIVDMLWRGIAPTSDNK
jgi:AcrR family transcriptional regulator